MASLQSKKIWEKLGLFEKSDGTVGIQHMPEFRNEDEEVAWHDRTHAAILDFAIERGLVGRRPAPGVTRPTSIRLKPDDVELARKLAAHHGLPYQTYIKMLLHQALLKEKRKAIA